MTFLFSFVFLQLRTNKTKYEQCDRNYNHEYLLSQTACDKSYMQLIIKDADVVRKGLRIRFYNLMQPEFYTPMILL